MRYCAGDELNSLKRKTSKLLTRYAPPQKRHSMYQEKDVEKELFDGNAT